MDINQKREHEKRVVAEMIGLYCHGTHGSRNGQLCSECQSLKEYAWMQCDHCPFMEIKTFCSNCKVHCYKPEMREKIKKVMRYSGPRMVFHHPLMSIHHIVASQKERKGMKQP